MRFILLAILLPAIWAAPVVRVKQCPVVLPTDATPRIVGGNEASPRTRSHVVSFYEEGCGGSLLSDRWILTAAHCLVHDGSVARISGSNSSDGVEIPVKRVINHPDYVFPVNDITLVELESPAPSSASFMAVNSNPSIPEDGEYARVAGYGFQEEGFDFEHDAMLRQVDVPVMNTQKCIDRYVSVNSYLREDISATKHICAGYDVGGCDSCTADSGGPLYVYDNQNTPVQIAIVSFGYGCAREVPGGYTRVSTYASWMTSVGAVFIEKTSRAARFGDSFVEEEVDDSETEEEEEQIDESDLEPRPVATPVPTPVQSSDAVPSSVPLPSDQDTPVATPDETNIVETPSILQTSPKPSPPGRLPPHIAVIPPPSNGKPTFSQGGHGGEGKPMPETDGSATSEPVPTDEDEHTEGTDNTELSNGGSSTSDAMGDVNKEDGLGKPETSTDGSENNAIADEGEEDSPEQPETDAVSSEEEDDSSEGLNRGRDTSNLDEEVAPADDYGSSSNEKDPDVHRPTFPNPQDRPWSMDAQPSQSENESDSESETTNNGSETEGGDDIEDEIDDDSGDGYLNINEDGSESNGMDASETTDSDEVPSPVEVPNPGEVTSIGETGNGADQPTGPMYSPGPSAGPLAPPSETIVQGFEELEPSGSPEVTESPEASSEGFDAEGGGLGALPISLIAIGSVLILAIVGYLVFYIATKRGQ